MSTIPYSAGDARHQHLSTDSGFFSRHGVWAPGVRVFRNFRFASKAVIISLVFMVPLLALLGWQMKINAEDALQARRDATRNHVEVAVGVVAWAHEHETSGKLSRAEAQKLAMQAVSKLRYDVKEYFWINDIDARVIMHPIKPELDGKDASGIKDPNGFALFSAFADTVRRQGKGFVAYQWPKPGSENPVDKISYVQGFEPWGWVIGSGVYIGDLREAITRGLLMNIGVAVVALLFAGYLFLCFYLVMSGGLQETRLHLHAMTDGDLTQSPVARGSDETAEVMTDLALMQESLRGMVMRVRASSDELVRSSSEIASGAMDLSARTEQAAANLEQSAASMDQIASTVKNTSDATSEAAKVANRNAEVAADGGRVMRDVVTTMDGIRSSSAKIGEIISTIDGIAFQTNILALNAAVEAARAGDQGRGFAVVASEVRTLAKRSAEAAKEIKSLIGKSVEQVESGTGIVRKAGATIEEIVSSSQRVNQLLGEVANGAREQSLGIGQIGQAVQELDKMTQQNAALVEESAASAAAMKELAEALVAEVSRFRMPADG